MQFRDIRGIRKVCFIEVDVEKVIGAGHLSTLLTTSVCLFQDDLWTTLEGNGYIVLFSVQHGHSYREATESIGTDRNSLKRPLCISLRGLRSLY